MADLDYDSALTLSATTMRRAMESEDKTFAIVSAIDSLRIALLAASRDLADTLDDRAALAAGTQVTGKSGLWSMFDGDVENDEPPVGHCGGYFCEVHNLHISCGNPDYDLLVEEHEASHAEVQDATAVDQIMAATELRQYLDTVERALQDDNFAAGEATKRLIGVVRAGITAGAALPMRAALVGIGSDQ